MKTTFGAAPAAGAGGGTAYAAKVVVIVDTTVGIDVLAGLTRRTKRPTAPRTLRRVRPVWLGDQYSFR